MQPEQSIDAVARHIFQELWLTMENSEAGIKENLEAECLHDFRIALRKNHVLLCQLKGVFPQQTIRRFKKEFHWLRGVSGPARDLDVHMLSFNEFITCLSKKRKKHVDPLFIFLSNERKAEQLKLCEILDSRRYLRVLDDWKKFINESPQKRANLINANKSAILFANESIWHSYKKILVKGRQIKPDSAPDSLHALRKKCKNLRYLIEFFQGMYPQRSIRHILDSLKTLQNNLGEYQDLNVQVCFLKRSVITLKRTNHDSEKSLKSMRILIEKLERRGQKVRQKFAKKFKKFSDNENNRLYTDLFKTKS